jgi:hypothetical protein
MINDTGNWIRIHPPFWDHAAAQRVFLEVARTYAKLIEECEFAAPNVIRDRRKSALSAGRSEIATEYLSVSLALHILGDLVSQGWRVQVQDNAVSIAKPLRNSDRDMEKQRVRRSLSLARDEQLAEPSVRAFVRSMESRRLGPRGWTSVYSLMRDGKEFGLKLNAAANASSTGERSEILAKAVKPYLQFVTEEARCEWTGLRLSDIWRYFRYTWLTPARSVPGRSMNILVRDAAIEPHPVIGIASLSSSIIQQSRRDELIGWDKASVLREVTISPTDTLAAWLHGSLAKSIESIYTADLATPDEIAQPSAEIITRLTDLSVEEKAKHQIHADKLGYRQQQSATDWTALVHSHLYRSKRASTLAGLLWIRNAFRNTEFTEPTADRLRRSVRTSEFRTAVARLVRQIKAAHVGINMMDISVAGAVAPYQAVLGGKLVSLLLASPEVRNAYASRYATAPSVIASAMKGESVHRRPDLVLLCTTGLFAGGSSQYNRIRLPANKVGGGHGEIAFKQLRSETEFATFHISQATMSEMKKYIGTTDKGATVNGIFGEGVNPKMRKISEGLKRMGFPPDMVLKAVSPRALYMIPLAHNYRDVLLGRQDVPDYILPDCTSCGATDLIAAFWRERWLSNRINRSEVIQATQTHLTTYPISHGAAVRMPELEQEQFAFSELAPDHESNYDTFALLEDG